MFPVAPEQIKRTPSECRSLTSPPIVEKPAAIIDVLPPLLPWHGTRWAFGIEPRESLSPCEGDPSAVFNKGRTFILNVGPPAAIGSEIAFIGATGANDPGDGTAIRRRLRKIFVGVIVQLRNRAFRGAPIRKSRFANSAISAKRPYQGLTALLALMAFARAARSR